MKIPVEKAIKSCGQCKYLIRRGPDSRPNWHKVPKQIGAICYCSGNVNHDNWGGLDNLIPLGFYNEQKEFVVTPYPEFEPPATCPFTLDFLMIAGE